MLLLDLKFHVQSLEYCLWKTLHLVQFLMANGAANEHYEMHINGSSGFRFIPNAGKYIDHGAAGEYNNTAHVFCGLVHPNGATAHVDGGAVAGQPGCISGNNNDLLFGCRAGGGMAFNGDFGEVIIYNRPLQDSERTQILNYFNGIDTDKVIKMY